MVSAVEAVMGKIDLDPPKGGGAFRPPKGSRSFAILRVGKISGMGKLAAAAQHNYRERDTFNARPEDLNRNIHLAGGKTADEVRKLWEERAPEKIRKNAVHALEYVVTASPEKMEEMGQTKSEAYLRDALTWLENKHGAENILSAVIHNDETTPHLQVLIIPLDDRGKLNARALVGGKPQLSAMQTHFAENVGAKHGLERGIERSGARHEDIRRYHGRAKAVETLSFELPERLTRLLGVLSRESDADYHQRLSQAHVEALKTTSVGFIAELDEKDRKLENKDRELADVQQKLAEVMTEYKSEYSRRHLLEHAHNVADYEGDDRQDYIAEFQEQYLTQCGDFPKVTRAIVDGLLEDMGAKGFYHIEQDRLAEVRDKEAKQQAEEREAKARENAAEKNRVSHAIERLSEWEARSPDNAELTQSSEGTREILGLLREATTGDEYDDFRQGDAQAISHITKDPLFAAQLLNVVRYDNLANGYEMSDHTRDLMDEASDLVSSHFDEGHDRDYENER